MTVAQADRVNVDKGFRDTYWDRTTGYFYFPNMGSLGGGGKDFTLAADQSADFTASAWTEYPIAAAGVDITTPASATSGDEFALIFTATRATCTVIANTGTTIGFGGGSPLALVSPGSSRKGILVLKLVGTVWIPKYVNTWA